MNRYKHFIITILVSLLSFHLVAQTPNSEYKASMQGWLVDLNEAQALSVKTGKPILANFTGTDWCGWCIRLKRDVFITEEFKKWASENVILLEVDFPKRFKLPENIQKQNAELQQAFKVTGYPTIWVFKLTVNPQTNQNTIQGLAKTGYLSGAKAWIKNMDEQLGKTQ